MQPAKDFTELLVWDLADELRVETLKFADRSPMVSDWKFRAQVVDAADSICRNIAEGFGAVPTAGLRGICASRAGRSTSCGMRSAACC